MIRDEMKCPHLYCIGKTEIAKGLTYSGFKKSQAVAELKKTVASGILDKSCFWTSELHISGQGENLCETICLLGSGEVNHMNPNLPKLMWQCFRLFFDTYEQLDKSEHHYDIQELRNHLCHLVTSVCLSPKAKLHKLVTWKKTDKMLLTDHKARVKRRSLDGITDVVKINDARDIYVPLNEIDEALRNIDDASQAKSHAFFWLSYLLETERRYKNRDLCGPREVPGIPENCRCHCAWPVWQLLFRSLAKYSANHLRENVESLYKLFRTGYTKSKKRTRIPYLIHAIQLTIGSLPPIDFSVPIMNKSTSLLVACGNINRLYKQIADIERSRTAKIIDSEKGQRIGKEILYVPLLKQSKK
jgi:hypothetical protein